MYLRHLSSLQFLTYCSFFAVVIAAIFRFVPGKAPPVRTTPYPDEELGAHDRKLAKYFVGGGAFLVLGSIHMVVKNLPWIAEPLARTGYAGHLVRDLSNTHVMIVGGGTLLATGLCWHVLPRIVGKPLASEGLAQCAFWFTAAGLAVFYVSLVGNGIAIGRLVEHGWDYRAAKAHMGNWYKAPTGAGAGVMGLGYWCFAANVALTIFQSRLVKVPKPKWHLWKFLATGAAALTVGTVQGVVQVQPAHADWLYRAGHAGEWIDPISHAHVNLVTGLTMLVAGALFALLPSPPSRTTANGCFAALLAGSLAFYGVALYLGFHEGSLVVSKGLTPEQAEAATPLHPFLIMGAGIAMFSAFWLLLAVIVRAVRRGGGPARPLVLAGCATLAVGTLQGPVQAVPAVNELLDRGGEAGDVVVNLHAQLNMLGGLMAILVALAFVVLRAPGRVGRLVLPCVVGGMAVYYAGGLAFAAVEAHAVEHGRSFGAAVSAVEPWEALVLVPAALAVLAGFGAYARAAWQLTASQRAEGKRAIAAAPGVYTGKIPNRVRRRSPAALAGYELPLGLMGFPGVGWLFAGFPFTASILLMAGPALTWAVIPVAFSPYVNGPLHAAGWKVELAWLPLMACVSSAALYRAHARRRRLLDGRPPGGHGSRVHTARTRAQLRARYRTRILVGAGVIGLVLVSLPFVGAVGGIGGGSVRYSYQRFTKEITGQFLQTRRGPVALFAWSDPQAAYPADALRIHSAAVRGFVVRAAAVDTPAAYQLYDVDHGTSVPLRVLRRAATQMTLAPARPLPPARYAFVASHEGMFGGRDYDYLQVVGAASPVTAVGSRSSRTTPAVAAALLPLGAALVALLFAALLLASFRRRPAGQKAFWAAGFALFAVAAGCEAAAQRAGWSEALFKAYYLAGGVLTVALLGAGSAWLLVRPSARRRACHGVVPRRLVLVRLRGRAARHQHDVLRLPVRRHTGSRTARDAKGVAACVAAVTTSRLVDADAEASEPGRAPHHDRLRRPAYVGRFLGMR